MTKAQRLLTALLPSAALLVACADSPPPPESVDRAADCEPVAAVAPGDRVEALYAENFSVRYEGRSKWVTVRRPWRGAGVELSYLLVPCGEPPPTAPPDTLVVTYPPTRVVTTSTPQLAQIVALDLVDRLVGVDEADFVNAPEVLAGIESGAVADIGDGSRVSVEHLVELSPDLVLTFSIGSPDYDVPAQLRGTATPFVLSAAYMESTPLARAEWLKFTALFFDREAMANRMFAQVAKRYEELAGRARRVRHRPTVLVGAPFRGVWFVSGGRSFIARLIADAGGRYLWADDPSTGGVPLDFETVFAHARDADLWLHPSSWKSLEEGIGSDSRFAAFDAFAAGRVYNNNARLSAAGGNDYWETGTLRPDLVLADLLSILHPELMPEHELYFYRRLR